MGHRRSKSDAGVTGSGDPNDRPAEPETEQEQEFLEAYRALDEADRVLLWKCHLDGTEPATEPGQWQPVEPSPPTGHRSTD